MKGGLCKSCGDCTETLATKGNNINVCIICRQKISYRTMNFHKKRAITKRFRTKHPDKIKKYRDNNKEYASKYHKEYRKKHKETLDLYNKEWKLNNPDKVKANAANAYQRSKLRNQ